ncbi:hypothetical protein SAY87_020070 [Trapa incisa]|uniref:Uncharacterized protein n=1 Tax=Trapa incisa TaxID=236973 RepID=A0AAN7K397_9MYRT|nr:hypothetical protein SAY87_020070 [Trapa incisa]
MAYMFSLGGCGSGAGRPQGTDHTGHRRPVEEVPTATATAQNPAESWFWPYGKQGQHYQQELWLQQQQQLGGFESAVRQEAQAHHHQQLGEVWGVSRPSSMNAPDESSSRSASVRGGGGGGAVNCQDCGNQAKKDCAYMRCRTCCKSRGFDCPTHVKSTWVPVAKRRERHQQLTALKSLQHHHFGRGSGGAEVDAPKRLRENHPSDQLFVTTSGLKLAQLPTQLESTALFRCVQVSTVEDPEDTYAYQTALTIGGRIFKGILYDQGPEAAAAAYLGCSGEGSSGGAGGSGHAAQQHYPVTMAASAAVVYDPSSSMYPEAQSSGGYMAGTLFFPHQRS